MAHSQTILSQLLLVLIISTEALHLKASQDSSISNELSSMPQEKFGFIPIIGLSSGYGVNVDFIPLHDPRLSNQTTDPNYMMLGLYTSRTILVNNCGSFSDYDCQKYSCLHAGKGDSANTPYFNFTGISVKANVYLDYFNWNLDAFAVLSTACTQETGNSHGTDTYGILGMGHNNIHNFKGLEHTFSIYLHKADSNGELIFKKDLTRAQSQTPDIALNASNTEWEIKNVNGVKIGSSFLPSNMTLIFDINSDAVGFPLTVYQDVLGTLEEGNPSVTCPKSSYYKPTCIYKGDLQDLPIINIVIGTQELALPPEIYAQDGSGADEIVLNLKGLSDTLTSESYIMSDYLNYLILDSNVMKYYYTVFNVSALNASISSIELYKAAPQVIPGQNTSYVAYYVIGGVVAFLILGAVGLVVIRKEMNRDRKTETGPLFSAGVENVVSLIEKKDDTGNTRLAETNMSQSLSSREDYEESKYVEHGVSRDLFHEKEDHKRLLPGRALRSDENPDGTINDILTDLNPRDSNYVSLNY